VILILSGAVINKTTPWQAAGNLIKKTEASLEVLNGIHLVFDPMVSALNSFIN